MNLRFQNLQAGTCTGPQAVAMRGAPWKKVVFPVICQLIEHPVEGNILYDTGFSPYLYELAKRCRSTRFYCRMIPSSCSAEESLAAQLEAKGIEPGAINK